VGKTKDRLESIGIPHSPNSLALQAGYVDRPIMFAKYRLPVTFGQNWPTQQSHGFFATDKLLVFKMRNWIRIATFEYFIG